MLLPKNNEDRNNIIQGVKEIVNEIFKVSLISYFLFLLIESANPGFVEGYFNLTILIYVVICTGLISLIFKEEDIEIVNTKYKVSDWLMIIFIGICAMIFIYFQIEDLGNLSYYISILAGIIIILVSFFLLNDNDIEDK
ncbi:MAG: hypothetical protein ACNFW9_01815 [Candidatus Kerfeldbacteria bacterium]|jgi:hypothetical protein